MQMTALHGLRSVMTAGLFLMLLLFSGSPAWPQQAGNPLTGANPLTGGADAAAPSPATRVLATEAASQGLFFRIGRAVLDQQRRVNRAINIHLAAIKRGNDPLAIWGGLAIAFFYGVFHVLGPGHGKTVIAGYFLGHHARWRRGLAMASWMALSHVLAAIVIVIVLHLILSRGFVTPVEEMTWLRFVSYGAIVLIGGAMLIQTWRGQAGHHHTHGHYDGHERHNHGHQCGAVSLPGDQGLLAVAAGFVPCSGAILVLVFCLTNNLIWPGVLMTLMIALGMALTLSMIGLGSIFLRRQTLDRISDGERTARWLAIIGPLLITLIGLLLLSGAMIEPAAM